MFPFSVSLRCSYCDRCSVGLSICALNVAGPLMYRTYQLSIVCACAKYMEQSNFNELSIVCLLDASFSQNLNED